MTSHLSTRESSLSPHSDPNSRVEPHSRRTVSPSNLLVSSQTTSRMVRRFELSNRRRAGGGNLSGSQRRKGFLSRWTTAAPRHLFRIG